MGWSVLDVDAVLGRKSVAVLGIDIAEPAHRTGVGVLSLDTSVETKLPARVGKDTPREDRVVSTLRSVLLVDGEQSLAGRVRPVVVLEFGVGRERQAKALL